MTRQDFFKKVGELFTKFTAAQQPQAEGNKEQPQESEKEKTETDAKLATEVTESKEAVTNEGNKEENKDADTFAKQKTLSGNFEVDYPSIAAELGTLRKKVQ